MNLASPVRLLRAANLDAGPFHEFFTLVSSPRWKAMNKAPLSSAHIPMSDWPGIWLFASKPDIDIAGGGIEIIESRGRNEAGEVAVALTSGHIVYALVSTGACGGRWTVLVLRRPDPGRPGWCPAGQDRGSPSGSDHGAGERGRSPGRRHTAKVNREARWSRPARPPMSITAGKASAWREGKTRIHSPDDSMPDVVHVGDTRGGEVELLGAISDRVIDAVTWS